MSLDNLDPREAVHDAATAAVLREAARAASTPSKNGKTPFQLLDLPFLGSMARVLGKGLLKAARKPDDWKLLDPIGWLQEYRGALLRHVELSDEVNAIDPESGESHYAAIAVNAMVCAYFERRLVAETRTVDSLLVELERVWGLSRENVERRLRELGEAVA